MLNAGAHLAAPLYQDQWRVEMILTFPGRPTIREIARKELHTRNGAVGATAKSYSDDEEMTLELLRVLRPLPEAHRLIVVSVLQESAAADDRAALKLYSACAALLVQVYRGIGERGLRHRKAADKSGLDLSPHKSN
jgi:hypothetical protein